MERKLYKVPGSLCHAVLLSSSWFGFVSVRQYLEELTKSNWLRHNKLKTVILNSLLKTHKMTKPKSRTLKLLFQWKSKVTNKKKKTKITMIPKVLMVLISHPMKTTRTRSILWTIFMQLHSLVIPRRWLKSTIWLLSSRLVTSTLSSGYSWFKLSLYSWCSKQ